ncbi:LCP family protein [Nocardiopsis alba]|uniref:LCP family protein n=1 Tax=Nocardiopsis alba TaxID=53437 RepID=UPI00340431C4
MTADENSTEPDEGRTPDETPETGSETEPHGRGDSGDPAPGADEAGSDPVDDPDGTDPEGTSDEAAPRGGDSEEDPETVVIDVDRPVTTSEDTARERSDADDDAPEEEAGAAEADDASASVEAASAPGDDEGSDTEKPAAESPERSGEAEETAEESETPVAAAAAPAASGTGRRSRRRRLRRAVVWTAASLTVLMCLGAATAYGYYRYLRSDMVQHDIGSVLSDEERPDKINDAVNILFIGSDGYEEDSPAYSQEFEGERSDSLMLAHISPENRVSVVSFPRDSLVQLPQCDPYAKTEGTYGYFGMINAAMYHGGPPCVVRTIESLTDIRIDHFVHLSFASFRDVVDSIGGVDICIPEPMQDRRSKLDLDAGDQTLDGEQALSFVRARYDIGDGGDIGRIDRQQMFMAALADQVTDSDVLTSPSKLNGILQAVARHSATDRELSLDRMLSIAVTMADVDLSDIEFHTVPWYQAPYDPNRVMWYEEEAAELFEAIREDRPLPALLAADDGPTPQEPPTASPTPADSSALEEAEADVDPDESSQDVARPGEGRNATSNPCQDGLGFGTGEEH